MTTAGTGSAIFSLYWGAGGLGGVGFLVGVPRTTSTSDKAFSINNPCRFATGDKQLKKQFTLWEHLEQKHLPEGRLTMALLTVGLELDQIPCTNDCLFRLPDDSPTLSTTLAFLQVHTRNWLSTIIGNHKNAPCST